MKPLPAIALIFSVVLACFTAAAQEAPAWEVQALNQIIPGTPAGQVEYDMGSGLAKGTNGVFIRYGDAVLTSDSAAVNMKTGDVRADGNVRIESGNQIGRAHV